MGIFYAFVGYKKDPDMLYTLLQTDIAQAVPVQQEMSYSLIEMAAKGGALMWVLLALSLIAIYIFGKKWWIIRQAGKIDKDFMNDIRDYIHDGKIKSARTLCSKYDAPVARMVEAGIARIGKPAAEDKFESYKEVLRQVVGFEAGRPELPILYNVNVGHSYPIGLFPLGLRYEIDCDEKRLTLLEPAAL